MTHSSVSLCDWLGTGTASARRCIQSNRRPYWDVNPISDSSQVHLPQDASDLKLMTTKSKHLPSRVLTSHDQVKQFQSSPGSRLKPHERHCWVAAVSQDTVSANITHPQFTILHNSYDYRCMNVDCIQLYTRLYGDTGSPKQTLLLLRLKKQTLALPGSSSPSVTSPQNHPNICFWIFSDDSECAQPAYETCLITKHDIRRLMTVLLTSVPRSLSVLQTAEEAEGILQRRLLIPPRFSSPCLSFRS